MRLDRGTVMLAALVLTWQEQAPMPRPRAGYMAGVVAGRLLVAGGSYWQNGRKRWTGRTDIFDPRAGAWSSGPALPFPLSDAAAATVNGRLYVFGGGAGGSVGDQAFVLEDGRWTVLPEARLPVPRLYAVAVAAGTRIFVLGGLTVAGDYTTASNSVWAWDAAHPAAGWAQLAALPGPGRVSHAVAASGGAIYVFGGATGQGSGVRNLSDCYRLDLHTLRWTRLADLPVARRAWSAVAFGGRILLLGGYTDSFTSEVFAWDPRTGDCHKLEPLPHAVADTRFLSIGNAVLGAGGEAGNQVRAPWTFLGRIVRP